METQRCLETRFDARAVLAGLSLLAVVGATEVQKRMLAAFLPGMRTDAETEKDVRVVEEALQAGDEKAAQNLPERICIVAFLLDYFATAYRTLPGGADAFGLLTRVPDEKRAFWKILASKTGFYFDGLIKGRKQGHCWRVRAKHFSEEGFLRRLLEHLGFSTGQTMDAKGGLAAEETGFAGDDAVAVMASLAAHTPGIFRIEKENWKETEFVPDVRLERDEASDPLAAYFLPKTERRGTNFFSALSAKGRAVCGYGKEGQPVSEKGTGISDPVRREVCAENISVDWDAVTEAVFELPGKEPAAHFAALEALLSETDADEKIMTYCRSAGFIGGAEEAVREAFERLIPVKSFAAGAPSAESVPASALEAYVAYFWGRIVCRERSHRRFDAKSSEPPLFAADAAIRFARFFEEAAKKAEALCAKKAAAYARSFDACRRGVPYEVECRSGSDAVFVADIVRQFRLSCEWPEKNRFVFWVRTADRGILAALAAHLSGSVTIRRDRASDAKQPPALGFLSMGESQVQSFRAQVLRRTANADPLASFFPQPADEKQWLPDGGPQNEISPQDEAAFKAVCKAFDDRVRQRVESARAMTANTAWLTKYEHFAAVEADDKIAFWAPEEQEKLMTAFDAVLKQLGNE